jgi:hypothetical protein
MAPKFESEQALVDALAHTYYQVVDTQYRTACMLNATVSCTVLRHFGLDAQLVPCQVWYSHPSHNYVIGFVGNAPQEGKWDGHLVCTTDKLLIDASLFHFNKEFGLKTPWIAVVPRIAVSSQMMARQGLSNDTTLKWLYPPPASDTHYPEVPQSLVQELAGRLIERLQTQGLTSQAAK